MEAVILAGGLGTRLRPLTYHRPKMLLPVAGKPMIEYVIDLLPDSVDKVVLAVSYLKEQLEEYFNNKNDGRKYIIINEESPLGTAGAIKNAESEITGDFVVLNGDIICSIDIEKMIKNHYSKKAAASISLWRVDDPTRYGVAALSEDNKITGFVEKPTFNNAPSNMINAGTYILRKGILDIIPKNEKYSMEYRVFPKIIKMGVYGFVFDGYWMDAGTKDSFINATKMVTELNRTTVALQGPECKIEDSVIDKYTTMGKSCVVEKGCSIEDSILLDNIIVKKGSTIKKSIIGSDTIINEGSEISDAIIGDKSDIRGKSFITGRYPNKEPENADK